MTWHVVLGHTLNPLSCEDNDGDVWYCAYPYDVSYLFLILIDYLVLVLLCLLGW